MKTITIRGIDSELHQTIKANAVSTHQSVNQWLLQALQKLTGRSRESIFKQYHDLDGLAGGWSRDETETFKRHTRLFESIDENIWK
jgi:hypothetical protein